MSVSIIQSHRPLWTCKLSDDKLKQYLDAIDEFELKGDTDNELLLNTADTWYYSGDRDENLRNLANDIYKEATVRWYDLKSQDKHISLYDIEEER